jgi:hypothetical protein
LKPLRQFDSSCAVACLADDIKVVVATTEKPDTIANDRMSICDQQACD